MAESGDWSIKVGALIKFTASDMTIENMSRTSRAKQVELRDCIGVITEPPREIGDPLSDIGTGYEVRFRWVTGPHAGSNATLTPHMRRMWVVSVIAPGR